MHMTRNDHVCTDVRADCRARVVVAQQAAVEILMHLLKVSAASQIKQSRKVLLLVLCAANL